MSALPYSDPSSWPSVGLCFWREERFLSGTRRVGGGAPMASRAADFTAVTARNGFGFFFLRLPMAFRRDAAAIMQ